MASRLWGRLREGLAFRKERDQILADMQDGWYTATQTMKRLEEHAKPGGRERDHRFSCRNGYAPCRCPFKFDQKNLVNLT